MDINPAWNHTFPNELQPMVNQPLVWLRPPRWPLVEVVPSLKCQNRHVESYLEDPRPQGLGSWEMSWSYDSLRIPAHQQWQPVPKREPGVPTVSFFVYWIFLDDKSFGVIWLCFLKRQLNETYINKWTRCANLTFSLDFWRHDNMPRHAQLLPINFCDSEVHHTQRRRCHCSANCGDARIGVCRVPRIWKYELILALHQNRLGDGLICDPKPQAYFVLYIIIIICMCYTYHSCIYLPFMYVMIQYMFDLTSPSIPWPWDSLCKGMLEHQSHQMEEA